MLVTIVLVCFANRVLDVATADATYPALFAFGDSILDTGNNNHLFSLVKCNYAPYGRDLPNQEPTGRFCNGKIPTDIIGIYIHIQLYMQFFDIFFVFTRLILLLFMIPKTNNYLSRLLLI